MTELPLAHVRVISLTQAWAGALATQLLGDMGADVIQVEGLRRIDPWRGGYRPEGLTSDYPAHQPGQRPYNRCARYNSVNRNKRCLTLDLSAAEGKRVFRQLMQVTDIVAENFSSRVMKNFGLDYAALREVNPRLIMISMPAYGSTGPYAPYAGIGGTVEPMSGIAALQQTPDGAPVNSGIMYPDPAGGLMGCAALLIALRHCQRTGQGQYIDFSLQESTLTFMSDQLMAYTLTGQLPPRLGNRDPWMAPHGNYRCQGEDAWVAIAVRSDTEWQRLCAVMGDPAWTHAAHWRTAADRRAHADELDAQLTQWTSQHQAETVALLLQSQGIPSAPVLTPGTVFDNVHLQARDFFSPLTHPDVGTTLSPGIPWRLSRTPGRIRRPAPGLGQHNEEVLGDILGLAPEEISALQRQGITGRP